jgi:putative flippase GtrA
MDLFMVSGFLVVMTALLWMIHRQFDEHFAQSALVGILGLVLGTVLAVILTPFTAEESKKWSNLTSAIVGALAGYGLGFINDSVGYVFKDARLLKDPLLGARTAIFLSCTLFSLVYGFSYRRYYVSADLTLKEDPDQDASKQS